MTIATKRLPLRIFRVSSERRRGPSSRRATRNLPRVKVLKVEGLNVYDLLDHEVVVCTAGALSRIEEALA